jgi:hypothetical protein
MKPVSSNKNNVDEFLDSLPEEERRTIDLLRKIIFVSVPGITEKLTYNVPFFRHHHTVFFLWPASVLWGKTKSYTGVRMGFNNSHLMQDNTGWLDRGGRKRVGYRDFLSPGEVEIDLLRSFIFEAIAIDEQLKNKKYGIR